MLTISTLNSVGMLLFGAGAVRSVCWHGINGWTLHCDGSTDDGAGLATNTAMITIITDSIRIAHAYVIRYSSADCSFFPFLPLPPARRLGIPSAIWKIVDVLLFKHLHMAAYSLNR